MNQVKGCICSICKSTRSIKLDIGKLDNVVIRKYFFSEELSQLFNSLGEWDKIEIVTEENCVVEIIEHIPWCGCSH